MGYYGGERYVDDDPPPRRERPRGDMGRASWAETTQAARLAVPEDELTTPGLRRRHRRNVVIMLCHSAGLSEYFIADAMGLARSRVNEIIKEFKRAMTKRR